MRPLSRIGWFCLGTGLLLEGIVFAHYQGFTLPVSGALHVLASLFWGGIALAGLFILLMSVLFLSA